MLNPCALACGASANVASAKHIPGIANHFIARNISVASLMTILFLSGLPSPGGLFLLTYKFHKDASGMPKRRFTPRDGEIEPSGVRICWLIPRDT